MDDAARAVVEEVYAAFIAGDLETLISFCDEEVEFSVRTPHEAKSYIGKGRGRSMLATRLGAFLNAFDVLDYQVDIAQRGERLACRIRYHYRDKISRIEIDGSMRHEWAVVGGKIVAFEVIHDWKRMSAYFELVEQERAGA
jgi:hypothetical protein